MEDSTSMTDGAEALVGVVIVLGVVGVLLPVVPGTLVVAAAIAVWAIATNSLTGWLVLGMALAVLGTAAVAKWWMAERHLRGSGVSRSTMLVGGVCGILGFFVIPVVGLVIGFLAGVYLAERRRHRQHRAAWRATLAAVRASGLALLVELAGALLAGTAWLVAALGT